MKSLLSNISSNSLRLSAAQVGTHEATVALNGVVGAGVRDSAEADDVEATDDAENNDEVEVAEDAGNTDTDAKDTEGAEEPRR